MIGKYSEYWKWAHYSLEMVCLTLNNLSILLFSSLIWTANTWDKGVIEAISKFISKMSFQSLLISNFSIMPDWRVRWIWVPLIFWKLKSTISNWILRFHAKFIFQIEWMNLKFVLELKIGEAISIMLILHVFSFQIYSCSDLFFFKIKRIWRIL